MILLHMFSDALNFFAAFFDGTNFSYMIDFSWFDVIKDVLGFIAYILPMPTIMSIVSLTFLILQLRVAVAIWKLLPLT